MLYRALAVAARFAWSSLLALRAAKPWRGRALEGFGGSGARFWTRGFCDFWPRGPRNRGGGVLYRALAVAARFAWSSLLALRAAKPWRGRALEGFGGSGARFWTRGFCMERSSLLASRAAKPWRGRTVAGAYSRGLRR